MFTKVMAFLKVVYPYFKSVFAQYMTSMPVIVHARLNELRWPHVKWMTETKLFETAKTLLVKLFEVVLSIQ